jgi:acetylornithine/succinyldiaminopimelate/putrescine aminotransferase
MVENKIVDEVERKGRWLAEKLRSLAAVKEVRQRGLFFAIDMESAEAVQGVVDRCLEAGLISFWFLSCPSSFRIAPPLVVSDEELEKAWEIISAAILES